jgi:thioredoxin 1
MATTELTAESIQKTISENDIVLVDFWADWCGPCKRFGPIFEQSSEQHPDVVHAKVDTEAEQQLAAELQITSIPTLMAFREGILVFNQAGALPAPALEQVVDAVKALDMDDVRAQIAAAGAAQNCAPAHRARRAPAPPGVRGRGRVSAGTAPRGS